jgi:hypothetical protein
LLRDGCNMVGQTTERARVPAGRRRRPTGERERERERERWGGVAPHHFILIEIEL